MLTPGRSVSGNYVPGDNRYRGFADVAERRSNSLGEVDANFKRLRSGRLEVFHSLSNADGSRLHYLGNQEEPDWRETCKFAS